MSRPSESSATTWPAGTPVIIEAVDVARVGPEREDERPVVLAGVEGEHGAEGDDAVARVLMAETLELRHVVRRRLVAQRLLGCRVDVDLAVQFEGDELAADEPQLGAGAAEPARRLGVLRRRVAEGEFDDGRDVGDRPAADGGLGLDAGHVDRVGQLGPPPSTARLGMRRVLLGRLRHGVAHARRRQSGGSGRAPAARRCARATLARRSESRRL